MVNKFLDLSTVIYYPLPLLLLGQHHLLLLVLEIVVVGYFGPLLCIH